MFEMRERDGLARIGRLETAHGVIRTPTLLPVINPNVITVAPGEMAKLLKVQALITNSYIIRKKDELRGTAIKDGLHSLLGFDGSIMTDSGTFQSHIYGEVDLDPLEIIEFQRDIGSDIGTVLDKFSEPDDPRGKAEKDLEETIARTGLSAESKGDMLLAAPVQGGRFPDLRERASVELSKLDCDVFPIGGVVPMMEGQKYSLLVDVVMTSKMSLDPSKPVHLFGCGHPVLFSLAVLMGCDMFDSSAYAKFAKEGRMLFPDGTRSLKELHELPCHCPICTGHTAEELLADPEVEKKLALHNLYATFAELRAVRQAIHEGRIWELAETRCRAHPNLLEGLKRLRKYTDFMERHEPLSRDLAFLYTSPESYHRPVVSRLRDRIRERYGAHATDNTIIFPEGSRPYSRTYAEPIRKVLERANAHFWIDSFFCPVPIELDEMYPISQSVIPEDLDHSIMREKEKVFEEFEEAGIFKTRPIRWSGKDTLQSLSGEPGKPDLDMMRVKAVADVQFDKGAGSALLHGKVELVKSKKTHRIRNVMVDGEHVLSMRAGDGLFTLKISGARLLKNGFRPPTLRVTVKDDSVEFNREGKSVFAAFVEDADQAIIPGDEVLVVDKRDELVAVGRALMTRAEMLAFKKGIAVKVREGIKSGSDD
jgi:7-cyano-7-deazaguanine tRNA-ribosyltransferase